jgi:hypothetical protein
MSPWLDQRKVLAWAKAVPDTAKPNIVVTARQRAIRKGLDIGNPGFKEGKGKEMPDD